MSAPTPLPPPPPPAPVTVEDASSQALAEAMHSGFRIVKLLMIGLVVLFFCSGVFVVQPNEVAVLLRFGRPVGVGTERLLQPGWHWAWPYPIDEKVRIPVGQSHAVTSTTGWYATTLAMEAANAEPPAYGFLNPESDGYTLTGDGNIIHVRATIKYRIADPLRYMFAFTNVTAILTNVVNEAIFFASARVAADDALYKQKDRFSELVLGRVQQRIQDLDLGVTLEPSDIETRAPADVSAAFKAVNAAEQDRSKTISDAEGYRDEVTRRAEGEKQAIITEGLTASNRIVQTVAADAQAFTNQLPAFARDPQLLERRWLTTTMGHLLTNANVKFYLPTRFDELRLQLNREPERPTAKPQP